MTLDNCPLPEKTRTPEAFDRLLRSLTGRRDFTSRIFRSTPAFVQKPERPEVVAGRKLLGLDINDDDYHLTAVLGAIVGYPEIEEQFEETGRSWNLLDYHPPVDRIFGGRLTENEKGELFLRHRPAEFPAATEWQLSHYAGDALRIRASRGGFDTVVSCRKTHHNGRQIILPKWPEQLGFAGGLDVGGDWLSGRFVLIRHTPVDFPYQAAAETIRNDSGYLRMLEDLGLLENFVLAHSPVEKLALAALALARSSVYF